MTKEEKSVIIEDLTAQLAANHVIYLADLTGLDAKTTSDLRRACFKANIKLSKPQIRTLENFHLFLKEILP